ncbi:HNH endonuclease [Nitrosospira sp. Nsp11]|uniref:HNH endonuclease n=1 Tax=Nitrosospira sp. Nsp11 TaxID=1855338 RepID=UPI0009180F44|nr:HNH endonuclease [Nitrosospira sp. Nsp11]SHM04911.1 HNH endonuclease [Nitrosospira sp. Nsp11]
MGKPWTDEEKDLLARLFPAGGTVEIAKQLKRSVAATHQMAHVLGIKKSADFEGNVRFKKGSIPPRKRKVGDTRLHGGYVMVKTEEGCRKFKLLHYEVWKQHHGSYPPQGSLLKFKDGNKENCNIANLECLTRVEYITRYSCNNLPAPLLEVVRLRGLIVKTINRRLRKNGAQHN